MPRFNSSFSTSPPYKVTVMPYRNSLSPSFSPQWGPLRKITINHVFICLEITSFLLVSTITILDSHKYGFWNALIKRSGGILLWIQHVVLFVVVGLSVIAARKAKDSILDTVLPAFLSNRPYLFLKGCFSIAWIFSTCFLLYLTVHPRSDASTSAQHQPPSWGSNGLAVVESVILLVSATIRYIAFSRSRQEPVHMELPQ